MAFATIDVTKGITGTISTSNLPTIPVTKGGTNLTSGTTDQFLKFTGTTTIASAADNAGIYNQIANVTISDGDSIEEVQSVFSSTYRNYMILLERIAVNTNSADLELKFIKSDGSVPSEHTFGASYIDSASYSARWGGVNASSVTVMQGQGQGAGKHVSGYMYCFDMNSTTDGVQRYTWLMSSRHHSSSNGVVYGGGNIATNAARTGIKLTVNSGTMYGGRIVVYGITNPS